MTVIMSRVDDPKVRRDEIVVKRSRLAELERKERAHDDYLVATRLMGQRVRQAEQVDPEGLWCGGYRQSLRDFCQLVVDQGRLRDATVTDPEA